MLGAKRGLRYQTYLKMLIHETLETEAKNTGDPRKEAGGSRSKSDDEVKLMSIKNHYYIEQTEDGRYAVRSEGSDRASAVLDTQREAIERARELNPNDHPDVERVRNTSKGGRDKWRPSRG